MRRQLTCGDHMPFPHRKFGEYGESQICLYPSEEHHMLLLCTQFYSYFLKTNKSFSIEIRFKHIKIGNSSIYRRSHVENNKER